LGGVKGAVVNWLDNARAVARRYQDPGLSALLVAQVLLIFIAEPLAFEGFEPPLIAIGIVVVSLVLLLSSDHLTAARSSWSESLAPSEE